MIDLARIRARVKGQMGPDMHGELSAVELTGVGADALALCYEVEQLRADLAAAQAERDHYREILANTTRRIKEKLGPEAWEQAKTDAAGNADSWSIVADVAIQTLKDRIETLEENEKYLEEEQDRLVAKLVKERAELAKALEIGPEGYDWDLLRREQENEETIRQLRAEREAIQNDSRVVTCVFCGHVYPPGTPTTNHDLLREHVAVCPDHPAATFRKRAEELEEELARVAPFLAIHGVEGYKMIWDPGDAAI